MCMVLCFQRFGVNRTACADRTGGVDREEQMTETARGREKELHRSQEVALGGVVSLLNLQVRTPVLGSFACSGRPPLASNREETKF
uniref:Uncharacterized protein n=1 Tax=Arundo donax TaxID=35708 RepID=A0A0A9F083_ARUDO